MVMQAGYTTNPTSVTTTTGLTNSYFNNLQLPPTGTPIMPSAPAGTGTVLAQPGQQAGFQQPSLFQGIKNTVGNAVSNINWGNVGSGIAEAGAAALPYYLAQDEIDYLRSLGVSLGEQAGTVAQTAAQASQFQPFSVRTTTGAGTTFGASEDGLPQLQYSLSPEEQAIQQGLLGQVGGMMGQAPVTAESLYGQIRAIQTPEEQRQRLELENRLAAQGRLGVQTAAYGGTPEQLAFEKAIQEAQNQASLQAIQGAPALQQAQIQNITGMLGAAYAPQQQAMAGLIPGIDISRIAQAAQQGQTEALYRGGIAGLEAQAAAGTAAANVEAARTQALANALSGMFAR